ncbi:cathepsin L [Drosophila grimshawi]|uniref:cathepsin L n=1 Tax=Drosophila grimshawi TaxID=7222 RepID=B4J6B6_DROGR|nr:cathepsin L [Drosophila grimshawi]EDW00889.1 GH20767 [Drosophila grimshawi]
MRAVIALLAFVGYVQAVFYSGALQNEWDIYKVNHDKRYGSEDEELLRKLIFYDHKRMIDTHNERYAAGKETYEMGVNQFTDMLSSEFESAMLGSLNITDIASDIDIIYEAPKNLEIPKSIDWRDKGAVTGVKDQLKCASCWAFSAVGALEGQQFLKTNKLVALSEQNLVDCSLDNKGCDGGWPILALAYVRDNRGIDTESSYSYKGHKSDCHFDQGHIGATVREICLAKLNDEANLAAVVATRGPISVTINVNNKFLHYRKGVFNDASCGKITNHAALIVGYGNDKRGGDYWLVKNSWGKDFGENGYIRMSRNNNNQCGIASQAIFPLV